MRASAVTARGDEGGLSTASRRRALVSALRLGDVAMLQSWPVETSRVDIEEMPYAYVCGHLIKIRFCGPNY